MAEDPTAARTVNAALLIIGNEILSGRTQDQNLLHFAKKLATKGIAIAEVRIVPDKEPMIVDAVNALRQHYDLVFTTGGIGPTHDDITADCIAMAFGVPIEEDPRAVAILLDHYETTDRAFTPARRRMARIPKGASLINNPVSHAPGFVLGNVYVMAGVPRINQAMLDEVIASLPGGTPQLEVTLSAAVVEGQIGDRLRVIDARFPSVEIGSYPTYARDRVRTRLVLRSHDAAALAAAKADVTALIRAEGQEPVETES